MNQWQIITMTALLSAVGLVVGGAIFSEWRTNARRLAAIRQQPLNEYAGRFLPEVSDDGWTNNGNGMWFQNGNIEVCCHSIKVSDNVLQISPDERHKLDDFTHEIKKNIDHRAHLRALELIDEHGKKND